MFVAAKVLPFFLVMLAGAALARLRVLREEDVTGLSRYVYWIGFPALLLHSLGSGQPPSGAATLGLVGYAAGAVCPLIAAGLLARLRGWPAPVRAALPMCAGLGNTGFLGLPLAVSLFGTKALGWAGAVVAIDWVLIASVSGAALHRHPERPAGVLPALAKGLFTPIVAGAALGVAQMAVGWRWPAAVESAIDLLSLSATATGLAALGAVLAARREVGRRPGGGYAPVAAAVALKLLAGPACVFLLTSLLGAPAAFRAVAVVMAACPTAVTVFIQARTAGVFAEGSAQAVALSTLLSAVTLTAIAAAVAR